MSATPNGDGTVLLEWVPSPGSERMRIHRDDVLIDEVAASDASWLDTDSVAGDAYAYRLAAVSGSGTSPDCLLLEATAAPVFASKLGFALAMGAAILPLAWRSRRT